MALLHSRPLEVSPSAGSDPLVTLQLAAERPLHALRPDDAVELWLHGPAARGASLTLAGPSALSFAVTSCSGDGWTRFTVVAEAPGAVRLALMVRGAVLRHFALVCRAPALDGFARCERAREAHRTRLGTLQSFLGDALAQLDHARLHLERAQHARMMEVQGLSGRAMDATCAGRARGAGSPRPRRRARCSWRCAAAPGGTSACRRAGRCGSCTSACSR